MARIDVYTAKDRRSEQDNQVKTFMTAIPFTLIILGMFLFKENQALGIFLAIIGLIWVGYYFKIKSVKLITLGVIIIGSLFYAITASLFYASRYSLENRVFAFVVGIICIFLFYRERRKHK